MTMVVRARVVLSYLRTTHSSSPVFWRDDKLASVAKPLIAHVSTCIKLNIADGKQALTNCLIAMTSVAMDDALLKSINLDLLMHTRAEDARVRIFALSCAEALWREQGGKLIGSYSCGPCRQG
jgi:U3 small nucleolar RNA-associated protein 10